MLAALLAPDPADAATFYVRSGADGGGTCVADDYGASATCTCRAAWDAANANPGDDRVELEVDCVLTRVGVDDDNTDGDLDAWDDEPGTTLTVALFGYSIAWGSVSTTDRDRVLHVPTPPSSKYPVNLHILGEGCDESGPPVCTRGAISGGYVAGQTDGGGCIAVRDADLHIEDTVVSGCELVEQVAQACARGGGAIEARGALRLDHSDVVQSDATNANGGGILGFADILLFDSLLDGNRTLTAGFGGGVAACEDDAELRVERSVLEDNVAAQRGGALWSLADFVHLLETEVRNNEAPLGGGLWAAAPRNQGSTPVIERSLFLENFGSTAGGAVLMTGHPLSTPAFDDIVFRDSTFSQNRTTSSSDTIDLPNAARAYTVRVERSTFYLNRAGSIPSVVQTPGSGSNVTFEYVGSILRGRCVGMNLSTLFGNVIWSASPSPCPGDVSLDNSVDPVDLDALGKLTGEPTRYHNITLFTPAHAFATCPTGTVDQRNNARPSGACDAGAIER
jgi:hypothetical protein